MLKSRGEKSLARAVEPMIEMVPGEPGNRMDVITTCGT